jgi:hypothetical protein
MDVRAEVSRILDALHDQGWIITEISRARFVELSARRPGGGGFYLACPEDQAVERLSALVPEMFPVVIPRMLL